MVRKKRSDVRKRFTHTNTNTDAHITTKEENDTPRDTAS